MHDALAGRTTAATTQLQVSYITNCSNRKPVLFVFDASAASDRNAVAYAATRLVPCHAAVSRALMHVKEALPRFAPKSFMDFGAGPGTATMAAGSVFPASAAAFTLVEPSIAMQVTRVCDAVTQRARDSVQGVSKSMLAGLSSVAYLPSLSNTPTKLGHIQNPKPLVLYLTLEQHLRTTSWLLATSFEKWSARHHVTQSYAPCGRTPAAYSSSWSPALQ